MLKPSGWSQDTAAACRLAPRAVRAYYGRALGEQQGGQRRTEGLRTARLVGRGRGPRAHWMAVTAPLRWQADGPK
jgi:hypothetical protein